MKNFITIMLFISFNSFATDVITYQTEIKSYNDGEMRMESVVKYVNGQRSGKKIAEKIYHNKTNELREVYVDGRSWNGRDKDAAERANFYFLKSTQTNKSQDGQDSLEKLKKDIATTSFGTSKDINKLEKEREKVSEDSLDKLKKDIASTTFGNTEKTNKLEVKATCEEITEQYVICNGIKFVRDMKNDDRLKRDTKKIEEFIDSGKLDSASSAVSK